MGGTRGSKPLGESLLLAARKETVARTAQVFFKLFHSTYRLLRATIQAYPAAVRTF
jgi:hypothetical protein